HSSLTRSPRRERNTNRSPDSGSWPNCSCTRPASESKLLRMSVGSVHTNTRPGKDRLSMTAPPTRAAVGGAATHRSRHEPATPAEVTHAPLRSLPRTNHLQPMPFLAGIQTPGHGGTSFGRHPTTGRKVPSRNGYELLGH